MAGDQPYDAKVWHNVDRLIDGAASLDDLRSHRLHLLAARRWSALGRPVPADLLREQSRAAGAHLAALAVLGRVRGVIQEGMVVFKGIELAARYPDPATRPFGDIDLLAEDADAVRDALLAAGFRSIDGHPDDYRDLHHVQPLYWPALPILIEVHRRPAWPEWMPEPSVIEVLETAVPSRAAPGVLAPAPAYHALIVAAHAWDFNPLGRAIDLLDVYLLAEEAGRETTARLAQALGLRKMWQTTLAACDALFGRSQGGRVPWVARSLITARDPVVLEQHVRRWMSPFWALPPHRAVVSTAIVAARTFLPGRGESWGSKIRRTRAAIANAFRQKWQHEREIGDEARRQAPRRPRY